jgi:hypothetical protein
MDDMGLDAVRPQPTRQPEAVPPAWKATAIRVMLRPALVASSRQRSSTRNSSPSSGASFFSGCHSTPGTIAPTSQLAWLISITAINVLSWSRATRDLLRSFGCGIGVLHRLFATTMVPSLAARPIPS